MRNRVSEEDIRFLIELKVMKLRRNGFSSVTYDQVRNTLYGSLWKDRAPSHLNAVCNDIAVLSVDRIVSHVTSGKLSANQEIDYLLERI